MYCNNVAIKRTDQGTSSWDHEFLCQSFVYNGEKGRGKHQGCLKQFGVRKLNILKTVGALWLAVFHSNASGKPASAYSTRRWFMFQTHSQSRLHRNKNSWYMIITPLFQTKEFLFNSSFQQNMLIWYCLALSVHQTRSPAPSSPSPAPVIKSILSLLRAE